MTQILNLPLLSFPVTVRNNEDWTDSWAYVDADDNPISLAGLTLVLMVRASADAPTVPLVASTVSDPINGLTPTGTIVTGGAGLNIVGLSIPGTAMSRIAPGAYVFEVQARGDGLARNIATGPLTVEQGVVR